MKPSRLLLLGYSLILLLVCFWPRYPQSGEKSSGLLPKEGDNFKAAGIPIVYQLVAGKKCRYPSAKSYLSDNPAFGTPYNLGGILICDATTVAAIPEGKVIPLAPNEKARLKTTPSLWRTIFRKDKAAHLLGYFVWTLLLFWWLQDYNWTWNKKILCTLILGTFLGILVELIQYHFIYGRDAEWLDLGANTVGILFALFCYKKQHSYKTYNNANRDIRRLYRR